MADQSFVVQGTLLLDGRKYAHGETIALSDPERIEELRALHAIATPFEVTPPEALQAQHEQVVSENEDLKAKLAELEAQLAGLNGGQASESADDNGEGEADATPKSNG